MANYKHLGPDEQGVVKGSTGKSIVNGPTSTQFNPFVPWEIRKATILTPTEYAVVQDELTALLRHEVGPMRLFLKEYDELIGVKPKVSLQKFQYVKFVDRLTGIERVERGPQVVVPNPNEYSPNGTQSCIIVDEHKAVLVMNKETGLQRLVMEPGAFAPSAYEEILEERSLVRVLPHEAVAVRHGNGTLQVFSGSGTLGGTGTIFFLQPYARLVTMYWSSFADPNAAREAGVRRTQADGSVGSCTTGMKEESFGVITGDQHNLPNQPVTSVTLQECIDRCGSETQCVAFTRPSGVQDTDQSECYLKSGGLVNDVRPNEGFRMYIVSCDEFPLGAQGVDSSPASTTSAPRASIEETPPDGRTPVTFIDLRTRKAFYSYEVRTSDNVKLRLDGTLFWHVSDVERMISTTSDPEGDMYYRARSTLIQAVSNVTLQQFMGGFNTIVNTAFQGSTDGFYSSRGIMVTSIELTSYECVDEQTATTLQLIIRESTNRKNKLLMQRSENDVKAEKLKSDISMEQKRTELIQIIADNELLTATTAGEREGGRNAAGIASFMDGLNQTLPEVSQRLELYRLHESLEGSIQDTTYLASGNASLFVTPQDMKTKLTLPYAQEL